MTAFSRLKLFEVDLFELLERHFVRNIDDASGETLVTLYVSHAAWSQDMIAQCLVHKKQPHRVYNYFKRYNEELQEHLVVNLLRNLSDINLKGVFLVLAHGNMAHLKRRSNVRLMRQFAVKGVETLAAEREAVDTAPEAFENLCAKYYEYSVRYCLNSQDRQELAQKFKDTLDIDI